MSANPIYGVSGGPVLDYSGVLPVCMEPAYTQFSVTPGAVTNGTLTYGNGWIKLTSTAEANSDGTAYIDMLYDGKMTLTANLTGTAGSGTYPYPYRDYADIWINVGSILVSGTTQLRHPKYGSYVDTRTWSVPYYRYRIGVRLSQEYGLAGNWCQINFTLS